MGRASLHRSVSNSSAFSDASFSSDDSYSTPTLAPTRLSMGFEDFVSAPADDSDDEADLPYAVLSRSPRRPSVAPIMEPHSAIYSAVESELSFSRDLFSYFDDEDGNLSDSFSDSSAGHDDVFF